MKTNVLKILFVLTSLFSVVIAVGQTKAISLKDAISIASNGNKEVKIQRLEENRLKEVTKEIKGQMLPSINAKSEFSHYFDRQVIFLPGSFTGTTNPVENVAVGGLNSFNTSILFSQPLLSKSISRQKKSAVINEKIQSEITKDAESKLVFDVSKSYLSILLMKGQLELQHKSLERNLKELEDAKSLYAVGRNLKIDTLRSFISVKNIKSSISYLKNSIEIQTSQFKKEIGLDANETIELTDKLVLQDDYEFNQLLNEYMVVDNNRPEITTNALNLLQSKFKTIEIDRPDIAIQELSVKLEERKKSQIKGQSIPQINLVGQYQVQSQMDDLKINKAVWPTTSFVGLQLTLPIYNGNKIASQVKQSNIRIEQEKIKLESLKDNVKIELVSIIRNWEDAKVQLDIQKKILEAANLNYKMNQERYANGLGSKLETKDAEASLITAEMNHLQAIYNLRVLKIELQKSLGQLALNNI